jgi:hypothetical protein
MKKIYLIITCFLITFSSFGQVSGEQINGLIDTLKASGKSDETIKEIINGVIDDPGLYNTLWKEFIDQANKQDSIKWAFLNDLNIKFKTFQTVDSSTISLGFSYDFSFDYANFKEKGQNRVSNSFGLKALGNVAFNKKVNPYNFLETDINYNHSRFIGGVVQKSDTAYYTKLNEIEDKLIMLSDPKSEEAMKLWNEFGEYLTLSNQFYYSFSPKFGLESNQDFSIIQFTPGIGINLGMKSWDKNNTLSKLNILDYPFALIRLITGTDKNFTPYGSTLPTAQIVFDYVIPQNDTIRENLIGNLEPFPRIKLEVSFRTFISRIKKENIFFNANLRYYQELSADSGIKSADLDKHLYFVMVLQSSSGFYVSYANGKLPFDAQNDIVYSIGFNYKF